MRPLEIWRRRFPVRLAVTTAALLVVVMAAMLVVAYTAAASLLIRQADSRALTTLRAPARSPDRAGRTAKSDERDGHEEGDEKEGAPHELEADHLVWSIHTGGPDGPERSALAWLWPAPGDVRVARAAASGGPVLVEELDDVAETLAGLRMWLAGLGLAGTLLVSGVAFGSARRAFAPLQNMIDAVTRIVEAQRISPETLKVQVPPAEGDVTLERLADLFNTMMARVGEAMATQARFVDDASHELRTPLGALRADLEVALRERSDPPSYRAALERALGQVVRLGRLADDLLALARYARGGLVQPAPGTDMVAAVRQALEDVRHLAEQGGVTVVTDMPDRLEATCDGQAISRLVTNLLRNAIEVSAAEGIVQVRLARQAGSVVIEVADSGPGMTPEQAARAFEPFFRVERKAAANGRNSSGAGLGLAIAHAIVEAHGGQIDLDTWPGRGTRVRVGLPDR